MSDEPTARFKSMEWNDIRSGQTIHVGASIGARFEVVALRRLEDRQAGLPYWSTNNRDIPRVYPTMWVWKRVPLKDSD